MPKLEQHPPALFDDYRDRYSEVVNGSIAFTGLKVDFFIKVKANYLLDLLKEHFGQTADLAILDVGCGIGSYHPLLQGHLRSISGIDVSAECLERASVNNPDVEYILYDGHKIPFPESSFDVAFAVCVMHHVPPDQWAEFSNEITRIVKPGGLVVIFEHNPWNPLTRRAVSNCAFDADAVLLRAGMVEHVFRQSGLTQVKSQFILTLPAKGTLLRRLDKFFGSLPIGAQYYTVGMKPTSLDD